VLKEGGYIIDWRERCFHHFKELKNLYTKGGFQINIQISFKTKIPINYLSNFRLIELTEYGPLYVYENDAKASEASPYKVSLKHSLNLPL